MPDWELAAGLSEHYGYNRNDLMLTFLTHEKVDRFENGIAPFWVYWQALKEVIGTDVN